MLDLFRRGNKLGSFNGEARTPRLELLRRTPPTRRGEKQPKRLERMRRGRLRGGWGRRAQLQGRGSHSPPAPRHHVAGVELGGTSRHPHRKRQRPWAEGRTARVLNDPPRPLLVVELAPGIEPGNWQLR